MKIVDQKMADECISAYSDSLQKNAAGQTTAVGFDSKKLLKWLKKVAPNCHEIQIKFGIYTQVYSTSKFQEGRTTVFLCPCDDEGNPALDENGNEIPPVNAGNPYP